jgi:L-threonylcarbamoyladenylate synthase
MILDSIQDTRVVELLRAGSVGIIPTDTIYGLVARAEDQAAVTRLYALKHRERKPGTLLAATVEQLIELGVSGPMLRMVEHLWPNPVSIVIPAAPHLAYLDQGLGDLAVRIPKGNDLQQLLQQTGPLVSSSANPPGGVPAADVDEAQQYFGQQVDFYVRGGGHNSPPSTVARLYANGRLETLRPGAVTIPAKVA